MEHHLTATQLLRFDPTVDHCARHKRFYSIVLSCFYWVYRVFMFFFVLFSISRFIINWLPRA